MLPPIKYKAHPKMLEIQQEKRKRRQILQRARQQQSQQLQVLKVDRHLYMEQNKEQIQNKQKAIYEQKLAKRNRIREEDLTRAERIADRKSEMLMAIIPERRQLIQNLRKQYLDMIDKQDARRKEYLQRVIQEKLDHEHEKLRQTLNWSKEQRMKENGIIDTNDGICVICLNEEAEIYMLTCKHLVCCKDCEFMIRMNKKCPLCRAPSKFQSMRQSNKKPSSTKSRTSNKKQ